MSEALRWFTSLARVEGSPYHWINIDREETRVGKMRARIEEHCMIIYSITIFPEFEGRGFARRTVDMVKRAFECVVADRVRPKAVGFWSRMGFRARDADDFEYRRDLEDPAENNRKRSRASQASCLARLSQDS